MSSERPLIDEGTSDFIQGGVSIIASSSGRQNQPTIVRAVGCLVSDNRRQVTVLTPGSDPFTDAVRETRTIAVAFTQPSTHQTIQLKGNDAEINPGRNDDARLMERYVRAFVAEVCPLGYSEELIRAMVWCDPDNVSRITFHPTAAFLQTPGPRAGAPLNV
ncbi:MAG TPA: hypothetical protein VEK15_27590 [Vicinamibacteria bacterium]|nr:hypothetical protein [Vicinamibacteria bacterium]